MNGPAHTSTPNAAMIRHAQRSPAEKAGALIAMPLRLALQEHLADLVREVEGRLFYGNPGGVPSSVTITDDQWRRLGQDFDLIRRWMAEGLTKVERDAVHMTNTFLVPQALHDEVLATLSWVTT